MKKYLSFFRIRFIHSLQYRSAALAGISTQFFWGMMNVLLFKAFYEGDPSAFPMGFAALSSYVWLQQAFLALFMTWFWESELFDAVTSGTVAYDLCRPVGVYAMWFTRSAATRCAKALLRCIPILLVASFIPAPYGLSLPASLSAFAWFILTMVFALGNVVALTMVIYMSAFFFVNPQGTRMVFVSAADLLGGSIVPLPFLPDGLRQICECLPFASAQNVPLRIYGGDLTGDALLQAVGLQVFWLLALTVLGKWMERRGLAKVTLAGG